MFTGIIETVGVVVESRRLPGAGARLTVEASFAAELVPGESVAVDGVCLTVVEPPSGGRFLADLSSETLARTTLGNSTGRRRVNLERSLTPSGRMGGHIVQGHVDTVTEVTAIRRQDAFREIRFRVPTEGGQYLVEKGSVTLDGISLTVASLGPRDFGVAVIPTTLAETVLDDRRVGSKLNVEFDVVAKYVERMLQWRGG